MCIFPVTCIFALSIPFLYHWCNLDAHSQLDCSETPITISLYFLLLPFRISYYLQGYYSKTLTLIISYYPTTLPSILIHFWFPLIYWIESKFPRMKWHNKLLQCDVCLTCRYWYVSFSNLPSWCSIVLNCKGIADWAMLFIFFNFCKPLFPLHGKPPLIYLMLFKCQSKWYFITRLRNSHLRIYANSRPYSLNAYITLYHLFIYLPFQLDWRAIYL